MQAIFLYSMMLLLFFLLAKSLKNMTIIVGLWLCFYGVVGNQLVVTANGGKMPVYMENVSDEDRIMLRSSVRHTEGDSHTRFRLLSDIIHIEHWDRVVSIGDVLMIIAVVVPGIGYAVRLRNNMGYFFDNNAKISLPVAFCAMITGIIVAIVQYHQITG
jgi:predicted tellurium resistance membrane protein TerC